METVIWGFTKYSRTIARIQELEITVAESFIQAMASTKKPSDLVIGAEAQSACVERESAPKGSSTDDVGLGRIYTDLTLTACEVLATEYPSGDHFNQ